jgi:hypothetical protein
MWSGLSIKGGDPPVLEVGEDTPLNQPAVRQL